MHLDPSGPRDPRGPLRLDGGCAGVVAEVRRARRRSPRSSWATTRMAALQQKRAAAWRSRGGDRRSCGSFADLVVGRGAGRQPEDRSARLDGRESAAGGAEPGARRGCARADDGGRRTRTGEGAAVADGSPTSAGRFDRRPLHWPLVFPEVFERGGFDAIIGNPPFLGGQKLTGSLGTAYREYLVDAIGRGARGSADLVAYFVLRAHGCLTRGADRADRHQYAGAGRHPGGRPGSACGDGVTIRAGGEERAAGRRSRRCWSTARSGPVGRRWARRASASADGVGGRRHHGVARPASPGSPASPYRLAANAGMSFQGSYVLGLGFTMEPDAARALIDKDPRNRGRAVPVPERARSQLAPGLLGESVGDQLPRLAGGEGQDLPGVL